LSDGSEPVGSNLLTATVTDTLYQGESIRVFLKLASGEDVSCRLPSNHDGRLRLAKIGQAVTLALHPEDTIIVPAAR
jgi:putative spermidine/putrescine transport system ATP-binding protein